MFKRMYTENEVLELAKQASGNKVEVSNITTIKSKILDALKPGDFVIKKTGNMKHTYIVTYKEEKHGICISYFAAGYTETVSYDYVGSKWVYNSTDVITFDGGSGDSTILFEIDMQGGTLNSETLAKIIEKPYNVIITTETHTGYMNPNTVTINDGKMTFWVLTTTNPVAFAGIELNVTTGEYTISM